MKDNVIDINMDRKCTRCGKPGATQGGLCLACVTKGVIRGDYDHIIKKKRTQP